ncbi:MAG: hypothetical protein HRT98_02410 [Mycoplasmatales bacterium]|nr:hypothetical protein [Mycoplasmatales bacterium]
MTLIRKLLFDNIHIFKTVITNKDGLSTLCELTHFMKMDVILINNESDASLKPTIKNTETRLRTLKNLLVNNDIIFDNYNEDFIRELIQETKSLDRFLIKIKIPEEQLEVFKNSINYISQKFGEERQLKWLRGRYHPDYLIFGYKRQLRHKQIRGIYETLLNKEINVNVDLSAIHTLILEELNK